MPNGFSGRPATTYLTGVSNAHQRAITAGNNAGNQTPANTPRIPNARRLPFSPDEANTGSFTTGRGNSTNIVVSLQEYEEITRKLDRVDDKIGECLYRAALEIEELCKTAFVMPEAVPRVLGVCGGVKTSLTDFRTITHELTTTMRRFAQEITSIG